MRRISQIILFLIIIVFVIGTINNSLFSKPWYCTCELGYDTLFRHCEDFCSQNGYECLYFYPLDFYGRCSLFMDCTFTYWFECSFGHAIRSFSTPCYFQCYW
jgi:hypothetical protein